MRKTILLVATIPFQEFTVIGRILMGKTEEKVKRKQERITSAEYFLIVGFLHLVITLYHISTDDIFLFILSINYDKLNKTRV